MVNMGKLELLLIQSVQLEEKGWIVKFVQKCKHCGTPNSFCRYRSMVKCGKCKKDYHMDDPKLQLHGEGDMGWL